MSIYEVEVTQIVRVELDDSKFDEAFMAEFRESFFPFYSVGQHAEHIGQLYARGVIDGYSDEFIEGYGPAKDMGIVCQPLYQTETAAKLEDPHP